MVEKKKTEEEAKIPSNLILYIGDDISYFQELETKYKELYPNSTAVFQNQMKKTDSEIQTFILDIRKLRPKVIFFDYATHTEAFLHVTRVWLRQNFHSNISYIGLCDYAQEKVLVKKAILTNMKSVHVKSTEFEAICFDIQVLAFPEQVENHGFATAKLCELTKVYYPCKLTRIQSEEIRIESNIDIMGVNELNLRSFLNESKILPTHQFKVINQEVENLYYNFDYAQSISPILEVDVAKTDDMSEEKHTELVTRSREVADSSKARLLKWVKDNKGASKPKFIKTLIIDKSDALFDNRPMSDSYNFVFRTQAYLKEIKQEVLKVKPHIIVFNLEKVSQEELDASADIAYSFNTGAVLKKIIQVIQNKGSDYEPYIIAFNTVDKSTEILQNAFGYKNIIGIKEPIQVELFIKMCELLRSKIEPKFAADHAADSSVYLEKNDPKSYAEIEGEITIKACSETDIYFDSDQDIPENTVFRVVLNDSFYVTVKPMPAFASIEAKYFGFIHGVGEAERQGIRQFINNIFFKDLQAKKALEKEEIEAQKQKFIEEQEALKKKEQEEKEKEAAKAREKAKKVKVLEANAAALIAETEPIDGDVDGDKEKK